MKCKISGHFWKNFKLLQFNLNSQNCFLKKLNYISLKFPDHAVVKTVRTVFLQHSIFDEESWTFFYQETVKFLFQKKIQNSLFKKFLNIELFLVLPISKTCVQNNVYYYYCLSSNF